jgi:hypothetical protein
LLEALSILCPQGQATFLIAKDLFRPLVLGANPILAPRGNLTLRQ